MKKAVRQYSGDFAALIGLFVVALLVGAVILGHQRLHLAKWVPFVGKEFVTYKAEMPNAQSLTPGQGQEVMVAGVPVGEVSDVQLSNGRALVSMKLKKKYTPIYRDATILERPKTGLNDEVLELSPGSRRSGILPTSRPIPVNQSLPQVNLDEILASLDGDTRTYLQALINGLGEGLHNEGRRLSSTLRRLGPTAIELDRITRMLSRRHVHIRRAIHNFSALSQALAGKDRQLADLVSSSNTVFAAFARQDAALRDAIGQLPATLRTTDTALTKADRLARTLGPTLGRLRPAARALGPALKATRPFLRQTTPVIQKQLRPFARQSLPTVRALRPAARDLAALTPDLVTSFKVVNYLLNTLAYDKPGDADQSYLFWLAWANHAADTVFSNQDAQGPTRRGLIFISCAGLETLDQLKQVNQQLGLLVGLLDPVRESAVCPQSSQSAGQGG